MATPLEQKINDLWDDLRRELMSKYGDSPPKAFIDHFNSADSHVISKRLSALQPDSERLMWLLSLSRDQVGLRYNDWVHKLAILTEICWFVKHDLKWKPLYELQAFKSIELQELWLKILETSKRDAPDFLKIWFLTALRQYGKSAFQTALGTEALKELRDLVAEAGLERELPLSWQNPTIHFKLNNHNDPEQVAYYHCAFPFTHVDWRASATEAGLGKEVYISSSSKMSGSSDSPKKGDVVVIYQCIRNVSRVVTHVLQLLGDQAERVEERFGGRHPALATMWQRWPFIRRCKILAVLKPSVFGGVVRHGRADLVATQDPKDCLRIDDLLSKEPVGAPFRFISDPSKPMHIEIARFMKENPSIPLQILNQNSRYTVMMLTDMNDEVVSCNPGGPRSFLSIVLEHRPDYDAIIRFELVPPTIREHNHRFNQLRQQAILLGTKRIKSEGTFVSLLRFKERMSSQDIPACFSRILHEISFLREYGHPSNPHDDNRISDWKHFFALIEKRQQLPMSSNIYSSYDGAEITMEGLRKVFEHPSYDATYF